MHTHARTHTHTHAHTQTHDRVIRSSTPPEVICHVHNKLKLLQLIAYRGWREREKREREREREGWEREKGKEKGRESQLFTDVTWIWCWKKTNETWQNMRRWEDEEVFEHFVVTPACWFEDVVIQLSVIYTESRLDNHMSFLRRSKPWIKKCHSHSEESAHSETQYL